MGCGLVSTYSSDKSQLRVGALLVKVETVGSQRIPCTSSGGAPLLRGVAGADLRPACVGVSVLLSTVSFIVVRDLSTVNFRAIHSFGGTKRTERAACLASIV